jgi:hypothetical protein
LICFASHGIAGISPWQPLPDFFWPVSLRRLVDQHSAGFDLLVWDHTVAAAAGMIVACYDTCFKNRYTNGLYWRAVS